MFPRYVSENLFVYLGVFQANPPCKGAVKGIWILELCV